MAPENQIHDFNPGITPNGLFWTAAIPDRAVDVNPGAGRARMVVEDLPVQDDFTLLNSLLRGPNVPAVVSFDTRWFAPGDATRYRNEALQFVGRFLRTQASLVWSAAEEGFTFQSGPAATSTTVFAEVGHERNGVFFS